jgi:Pterin binding enzyme
VGAVAAGSGPPVPVEEEAGRLVPAIKGMVERAGLPVSADTFSPEVARLALAAGAVAINDIGGGSEAMFRLAAESGCGLVLMHIEGPPRQGRGPHPATTTRSSTCAPGSSSGSRRRSAKGSPRSSSPSTPASTSTSPSRTTSRCCGGWLS